MNTIYCNPRRYKFGDLEILGLYKRNKNSPVTEESLRIHVKNSQGETDWIWLEVGSFLNAEISLGNFEGVLQPNGSYKNKTYVYHPIPYDSQLVHNMFAKWKSLNPMVHNGDYTHSFLNTISNYDFTWEFEKIKY